jgi:hypothetical protein
VREGAQEWSVEARGGQGGGARPFIGAGGRRGGSC